MAFILIDSLIWFFEEIFLKTPRKPHKPEIETPKIGGYLMLAQTLHIQWNNLILPELLHNSLFFPHNQKLFGYLKREQSYDVLTWPYKKTFSPSLLT